MRLSRKRRRRLLVVVVAVLTASICMLAFGMVRTVQQQRLLAEARSIGLAQFQANNFNAALQHLSYYFEHVKDDLEVNQTFAEARSRLPTVGSQHLFETIDLYANHCLRLLNADPQRDANNEQRRVILSRLLEIYCQLGMRFEIVQTADSLLAIDPDRIDALAAKAEVLCLNREFNKAMPIAQQLIERDPNNLTWRRMHLHIQGETGVSYKQRVEQCRAWAAQYHGDGRFHLLTATVLLAMEQVDEARDELESVVELGADNIDVLERAVGLLDLMDQRDHSDALITATKAKFPQSHWVREVSVRRRWHANELEQALAELQQAEDECESLSADLQRLRVIVYVSGGEFERANDELQALRLASQGDKHTDAVRAWTHAIATVLDRAGSDWRLRLEALNNAIALSPQDAVLHSLMGDAWIEVGERSRAVWYYQQAHALDPDWIAAGIAYTNALLNAGRFGEAYQASRIIISRAPNNQYMPFILYAKSYLALSETGRAHDIPRWDSDLDHDLIQVLKPLHEEDPNDEEVAALLAQALLKSGKVDDAIQFAADIAQRVDVQADTLLALADVFAKHYPHTQALLLHRAQEIAGLTVSIAFALAESSRAKADAAGGLTIIDQAIAAQALDNDQLRLARLARLEYMCQNQMPAAHLALDEMMSNYPDAIEVQQLVLAQPLAWDDSLLVARALANLKRSLGDQAPQVRLAEANFLIRHHGRDDALLAKAIVQIESVLEQSPDSLAALSLMAEAQMLSQQTNIDHAIECLEHAVNLYSAEPHLMVRLIALLQKRGDFAKAGHYLRRMARLTATHPQLQRAELRLWRNQNDFETALVRAAALVNESSPPPDQLLVAAIHQEAGQRNEAQAIYERLLATAPNNPLVLSQAAEFFAATGRFERGVQLVQAIQTDNNSVAKDVILGSFFQRYGRLQQAYEYLSRAVREDPQSTEGLSELARYHLSMRQHQQAFDHALHGLRIDPINVALRSLVVSASLGLPGHDFNPAMAALNDQRNNNADVIAILTVLNEVPATNGRFAPTEANLVATQHLVKTYAHFMPAWQTAVALHSAANQPTQAIALARSAVSRFPNNAEPTQWATQLLAASGHWHDALAEAQEWRRRSSGTSTAIDLTIASILLEVNRGNDAVRQLEPHADQLLHERALFPDRLAVFVRALALAGRFDRASSIISPLFDEDGRWRHLWLDIARRIDLAYCEEALSLLERSTTQPDELLTLATEWVRYGQCVDENSCFDRAHSLAMQAAGAGEQWVLPSLLVRGSIAEARSDWPAAELLYRQALSAQPNHPTALNNLAFVLSHTPQRCSEALSHIQQAMTLRPDQPDFLDTYAHVLACLNRNSEAEAALQNALSLRPDDLEITLSLIDVQLRSGKHEGLARQLLDLEQQVKFLKRPKSGLHQRFEALWKRLQQSQDPAPT